MIQYKSFYKSNETLRYWCRTCATPRGSPYIKTITSLLQQTHSTPQAVTRQAAVKILHGACGSLAFALIDHVLKSCFVWKRPNLLHWGNSAWTMTCNSWRRVLTKFNSDWTFSPCKCHWTFVPGWSRRWACTWLPQHSQDLKCGALKSWFQCESLQGIERTT